MKKHFFIFLFFMSFFNSSVYAALCEGTYKNAFLSSSSAACLNYRKTHPGASDMLPPSQYGCLFYSLGSRNTSRGCDNPITPGQENLELVSATPEGQKCVFINGNASCGILPTNGTLDDDLKPNCNSGYVNINSGDSSTTCMAPDPSKPNRADLQLKIDKWGQDNGIVGDISLDESSIQYDENGGITHAGVWGNDANGVTHMNLNVMQDETGDTPDPGGDSSGGSSGSGGDTGGTGSTGGDSGGSGGDSGGTDSGSGSSGGTTSGGGGSSGGGGDSGGDTNPDSGSNSGSENGSEDGSGSGVDLTLLEDTLLDLEYYNKQQNTDILDSLVVAKNEAIKINGNLEDIDENATIRQNELIEDLTGKFDNQDENLENIDESIKKLDKKFEDVDGNNLVQTISDSLTALSSDTIEDDVKSGLQNELNDKFGDTLNDTFSKYSNALGFGSGYDSAPNNITVKLFNKTYTLIDFSVLDAYVSIIRSLFLSIAYLLGFLYFLRGDK